MTTVTATRRFYLVQRIKRSRLADIPVEKRTGIQKIGSNPFGYGNLGDYDLDYMGSAEFEWGAIPEAFDRLVKARKKGIELSQFEYEGHSLDFLWIEAEGDPFADWVAWVEGKPYMTRYGTADRRPCEGKETPYELRDRLAGKEPSEFGWRADVWWALTENVMWAFSEDGHLQRMLDSMAGAKNRMRGA
jgi:hypothetical protein